MLNQIYLNTNYPLNLSFSHCCALLLRRKKLKMFQKNIVCIVLLSVYILKQNKIYILLMDQFKILFQFYRMEECSRPRLIRYKFEK